MKFTLCTNKKPAGRIKKLASVINASGHVAMECQTQPSEFQFKWFSSGSIFEPELASDTNNKVGDPELEDKRRVWVVVMTVAPAVLRVEHRSGRKVVVVKARVLLEETTPLLEEKSEEESLDGRSGQETDEENGASDEESEKSSREDGDSEQDDASSSARTERCGESEEEATEHMGENAGNLEHCVSTSEDEGVITDIASETSENKRETEGEREIEDERKTENEGKIGEGNIKDDGNIEGEGTTEVAGSCATSVGGEADQSEEERKEEQNLKEDIKEIEVEPDVMKEMNVENQDRDAMARAKEVEHHEARISHGTDKGQVDPKVAENEKGGDVGGGGSRGLEENKETADHDGGEISPEGETSGGNVKCENTTEERGDFGEEGSHEAENAREIADHKAGIRHGDKAQAHTKVAEGEQGGNADDESSCREEGIAQTADCESETSFPEGSPAEEMKCHDTKEKGENSEDEDSHREGSSREIAEHEAAASTALERSANDATCMDRSTEKGENFDDQRSHGAKGGGIQRDVDTAVRKISDSGEEVNFEDHGDDLDGSREVATSEEDRLGEEEFKESRSCRVEADRTEEAQEVFGDEGQTCGGEATKSEEIPKTQDEESCEHKDTKGEAKCEDNGRTEEFEESRQGEITKVEQSCTEQVGESGDTQ